MGITFRPVLGPVDASHDPETWPVDPRFTMARGHVEFRPHDTKTILAIDDAWQTIVIAWRRACKDRHVRTPDEAQKEAARRKLWPTLIRDFLYGFTQRYPDEHPVRRHTYFPVTVRRPRMGERDELKIWPGGLTELVRGTEGEPPGIVLIARSGAGKTAAAFKAFFDCLEPELVEIPDSGGKTSSGSPALAGYMPCWTTIDPDVPAIKDALKHHSADAVGSEVVEQLIARAYTVVTGLGPDDAARWANVVHAWLNTPAAPKLLAFFDLNAASASIRQIVAQALVTFQRTYGQTGHRCVVAYRSTEADDGVMTTLRAGNVFSAYEMDPLWSDQARQYVEAFPRFEQHALDCASTATGFTLAPAAVDPEELERRRALVDQIEQYCVGHESLISTPLLMHFVSRLSSDDLQHIRNATDLYGQVLRRLLVRNEILYGDTMPPCLRGEDGRKLAQIAAVRIALAIHAGGSGNTTCSCGEFERALTQPRRRDWPWRERVAKDWLKSPYFNRLFCCPKNSADKTTPDEVGDVREYSLFHGNGKAIGFLHDSVLYFCCAYALRYWEGPSGAENYHEGPGQPAVLADPQAWASKAAQRMLADPQHWVWPAAFLGGMLDAEQLKALVGVVLESAPAPGVPAMLLSLLRGAGSVSEKDDVLRPVLRFLDREQHRLRIDPDRLYQELRNELLWMDKAPAMEDCDLPPALACLLARSPVRQWLESLGRPARPALMLNRTIPMQGRRLEVRRFVGHQGPVGCVAFSPNARRIISGSSDNIRLWDCESGQELRCFSGHAGIVYSVSMSSDGHHFVSASHDRTIRLWDVMKPRELRCFGGHEGGVLSVCFSPDGHRVLSSSEDRTLRLWDVDTCKELGRLEGHEYAVSCACFSPDGREVLSGSDDGTLRLWDPNRHREIRRFKGHTAPVNCVCFSPDGQWVASGSKDSTVRLWRRSPDSLHAPHPLDPREHARKIREFLPELLKDISLPSHHAPLSPEQETFSARVGETPREGMSCAQDAIPDMPSLREVNTGRYPAKDDACPPSTGSALCTLQHPGAVTAVCFSLQGDRILSASQGATIAAWSVQTRRPEHWYRNLSAPWLAACFFPSRARAVTGTWEGTVLLYEYGSL